MVIISVDGVTFSYRSGRVLDGIDLDLSGPGITSIIGPNGVGKSTLLHCMNRLVQPGSGTVMVDGEDVSDLSLRELARTMGYVPYSSRPDFPLTVLDTVVMGRHPYSRVGSVREDVRAAHAVLLEMGVDDLAFRPMSELSAGQRQKVMLARGIVQDPRVLLLDEPTANLDIRHQMEVTAMLRDLCADRGMCVVMVSHDLNIAAKYSDTVVLMHRGRIHAAGTPSEVLTPDNLRTVYGVDADVVDHRGRPYVMLNEPVVDDERDLG